jgi:hypothetical protein
MSLSAIITLKNDGAVYLLDYLSPIQYLTQQGVNCELSRKASYEMSPASNISINMDVYELTNKTCIGRLKYRDTLYHMIWDYVQGKEGVKKIANAIENFLREKSHSNAPDLKVNFKNFHQNTHELRDSDNNPLKDGYDTLHISDLAHETFLDQHKQ